MNLSEYLKAIPSSRRPRVDQLMAVIQDAYPDVMLDMQYRMPTFHNGDKGWCALANQKHYISLYTCGEKNIADFKAKYPRIKCGKGCINFKDSDALPIEAIKKVIDNAMHASVKCEK